MEQVGFDKLLALAKRYQNTHPTLEAPLSWEERLAFQISDKLAHSWQAGWDFETANLFFGDRGVSLLLLNCEINWLTVWDEVMTCCSGMPAGAMINFEVCDSIRDGQMVGRETLVRRLILSDGVYELKII